MVELDKLIIALYEAGVSTRKISAILRRFYGSEASATLVSAVTERVAEKLKQWRSRPLPRRLAAAYIDAGFFDVRRDTVEKEAVYFVLGVDEEGRREIIHFMLAPCESATAWRQVLESLRQRGLQEVDFIVADGLAGFAEAAAEVSPAAAFQLWAGEGKSLLAKVRARDRAALAYDLKLRYKTEKPASSKGGFYLV